MHKSDLKKETSDHKQILDHYEYLRANMIKTGVILLKTALKIQDINATVPTFFYICDITTG